MKNRKLQRVLTWILTLTMILGTFGETGLALQAADADATEEVEAVDAGDADAPDPDQYFMDSQLDVVFTPETDAGENDGTDHVAVLSLNGSYVDVDGTFFFVDADDSYKSDGVNEDTSGPIFYDSKFDKEVYVVPAVGYRFNPAVTDLEDLVQISGGWKYKDQDAVTDVNGTAKPAYTIEKVSIAAASEDVWYGSEGGNYATALKVTLKADSDLAAAFAAYADNSAAFEAYTEDVLGTNDPEDDLVRPNHPWITISPISCVPDVQPIYLYLPNGNRLAAVATAYYDEVCEVDDIIHALDGTDWDWRFVGVGLSLVDNKATLTQDDLDAAEDYDAYLNYTRTYDAGELTLVKVTVDDYAVNDAYKRIQYYNVD